MNPQFNELMIKFLDFLDEVDVEPAFYDAQCNDLIHDLHKVLLDHRNRMTR